MKAKSIKGAEELKENEMPEAGALIVFSCAGRIMAFGPMMNQEIEGINIWDVPMAGILSNSEPARVTISFKLNRTEKVKWTTAILLEETIEELEQKRKAVEETNAALKKSIKELKAAQKQLIQAEKGASLGEVTAGIAHEIQNPLNLSLYYLFMNDQ